MINNPRIGMRVIVKYNLFGEPLPDGPVHDRWYRNKNTRGVINSLDPHDADEVLVNFIGSPEAVNIRTSLHRLEEDSELYCPYCPNLCRGGQDL